MKKYTAIYGHRNAYIHQLLFTLLFYNMVIKTHTATCIIETVCHKICSCHIWSRRYIDRYS